MSDLGSHKNLSAAAAEIQHGLDPIGCKLGTRLAHGPCDVCCQLTPPSWRRNVMRIMVRWKDASVLHLFSDICYVPTCRLGGWISENCVFKSFPIDHAIDLTLNLPESLRMGR